MIDKTQKTRQQRRRKALNEAAQSVGYPSWSAYETAVLNGETHLTMRAADGAVRCPKCGNEWNQFVCGQCGYYEMPRR